MTEDSNEKPQITRRDVLKVGLNIAKGGAAAAVLSHIGLHEGQKVKENNFVINGVRYFPFYELHDVGYQGEVPDNLDVTFWELNDSAGDPNTILKADPWSIDFALLTNAIGQLAMPGNTGDLWLSIRKNGGRIALGDVASQKVIDKINEFGTDKGSKKELARFSLGLVSLLTSLGRTGVTGKFSEADTALGLGGAAAILSSKESEKFLVQAPEGPITRILYRLQGMTSNFRVDDVSLLYRNLVMADKILLLGEHFYNFGKTENPRSNEYPRVGFNLGKAHQGIEDLLYLGRPNIHKVLLAFYTEFVRENVSEYGMDFIPKVRVLKYEDARSVGKSLAETDLLDEFELVDQELLSTLKEKFPEFTAKGDKV
jgi:hypothetical protein